MNNLAKYFRKAIYGDDVTKASARKYYMEKHSNGTVTFHADPKRKQYQKAKQRRKLATQRVVSSFRKGVRDGRIGPHLATRGPEPTYRRFPERSAIEGSSGASL